MTMDEEQIARWVEAQREEAKKPRPPRKKPEAEKQPQPVTVEGVGEWVPHKRLDPPSICPRCSRRLLGSSRWCQVHGDHVDVGAMPFVEEHVIRYEGRRRRVEDVLHGLDDPDRQSDEERDY